jgi:hypothetical protein
MTVEKWIDENMNLIYGKPIRIIDSKTKKGVGDSYFLFFDKEIKKYKITSKFTFIFI